ncbi:MAG: glycerophosphodiester phosphodiesterase [Niveispirillum sp.]|uniref:glycerophosphodiester phosphodiesterase family protein n=1 Tax=Niveispirillum sp. TaxID=1917217 RepID=UPI0009EBB4A1
MRRKWCVLVATLLASTVSPAADLPMGSVACGGLSVQAHRGGDDHAENSLAAIRQAAAQGVGAAEIDIQQLSDGEWVLHHDAVTGRVVKTRGRVPVGNLTAQDWRAATIVGADGKVEGSPSFLADALFIAKVERIALNIEIKQPVGGCASLTPALSMAASSGATVIWSTVFNSVAQCLAEAGADYVGIVVGPPSGKVVPSGGTASRLLSGLPANMRAKVEDRLQSGYDDQANRALLTEVGISGAARRLVGAGSLGLHVAAADFMNDPQLLRHASNHGFSVGVYTEEDPTSFARWLSRQPRAAWPASVIIDGSPQLFCSIVQSHIK